MSNEMRVVLTGTSNRFLWPRLPVAGLLIVNELGVNGSIIHASFRIAKDGEDGGYGMPVEVTNPRFVYADQVSADTGAAHYHTSRHHLAQATALQLEFTRRPHVDEPDMYGMTVRERIDLHLRYAGVQAQLAAARTVGALLMATPSVQIADVEAEQIAWAGELAAGSRFRTSPGDGTS